MMLTCDDDIVNSIHEVVVRKIYIIANIFYHNKKIDVYRNAIHNCQMIKQPICR